MNIEVSDILTQARNCIDLVLVLVAPTHLQNQQGGEENTVVLEALGISHKVLFCIQIQCMKTPNGPLDEFGNSWPKAPRQLCTEKQKENANRKCLGPWSLHPV